MDLLDPEGSDAASGSSSDGVGGEARAVAGEGLPHCSNFEAFTTPVSTIYVLFPQIRTVTVSWRIRPGAKTEVCFPCPISASTCAGAFVHTVTFLFPCYTGQVF